MPLILLLKSHMNLGKEKATTVMSRTKRNELKRESTVFLFQRNATSRGRTTDFCF